MKYRGWLEIVGLFCLSLILFTWGLSSEEVIGFDSRFYLFALEMWRYGASWFPTTYHQSYADYPATATFLIYLFAKLFGGMNKLIAVLPTAIAAAMTLTITYCIGALHSKRFGLYAVFFMLLTITFLQSARSISLDMYTAMITAWCFYLVYSADREKKPGRVWWIYPLLFLGFAFRGPIGLVIPTGVICTYYLLDLNFKRFFISGFLALLLLILGAILLLALAEHTGGVTFMHDVLRMQILGRIDNSYLPIYFYFTNSIGNYALSFVIACLVIVGAAYSVLIRRISIPEAKFLLKLIGWLAIILIGMSIPDDKKSRYIFSIVPAIALIAAYPFAVAVKTKYFSILRWVLLRIFLYFPAIFILLIEVVFYYAKSHGSHFNIHYLSVILFLFIMQVLSFLCIYRYAKISNLRDMFVLFIATISFVATYRLVVEPIALFVDRARDFVVTVEAERLQEHALLVFYKEGQDGLPIKYLINTSDAEALQPVFIKTQAALINFLRPAFFVTSVSYFDELPKSIMAQFEIVANDMLGHTRVVVFRRKF